MRPRRIEPYTFAGQFSLTAFNISIYATKVEFYLRLCARYATRGRLPRKWKSNCQTNRRASYLATSVGYLLFMRDEFYLKPGARLFQQLVYQSTIPWGRGVMCMHDSLCVSSQIAREQINLKNIYIPTYIYMYIFNISIACRILCFYVFPRFQVWFKIYSNF